MNEEEALAFAAESIVTLLQLAAPVIMVGLVVGLTIALFQALTQIQEITLTFVPKIIIVFLSLLVFLPFMLDTMQTFMANVADRIASLG